MSAISDSELFSTQWKCTTHNRIVDTFKYYDNNTLTKMYNLELGDPITEDSLEEFLQFLPETVKLFVYKIIETRFEVDKITADWHDKSLEKLGYEHQEVTYNKIKKLLVEKLEPVLKPYLLELIKNMRLWKENDRRWKPAQKIANELAKLNMKFEDPTKIDNKYIKSLKVYSAY